MKRVVVTRHAKNRFKELFPQINDKHVHGAILSIFNKASVKFGAQVGKRNQMYISTRKTLPFVMATYMNKDGHIIIKTIMPEHMAFNNIISIMKEDFE